jgi:uncharacterized membrane protein
MAWRIGNPPQHADMKAEATDTTARLIEWNFQQLAAALVLGFMLQAAVLPCLCAIGTAKMSFAIVFDLLAVARGWMAYRRHETGRGWVLYAVLCYTSAGWIEGIAYLVLGDT